MKYKAKFDNNSDKVDAAVQNGDLPASDERGTPALKGGCVLHQNLMYKLELSQFCLWARVTDTAIKQSGVTKETAEDMVSAHYRLLKAKTRLNPTSKKESRAVSSCFGANECASHSDAFMGTSG
ncbi:MAG: hypothetical protein SGPRY_005199 [Prymnesium sp.]